MKRPASLRERWITKQLLRWFKDNKRDFPWRNTFDKPDPYIILFSEVMLQRTKADQVVPVYRKFVRRYPNFEALEDAPKGMVFTLFSSLGLRWRARNVIRLIRVLRDKHFGEIPNTLEDLSALPGVGDYVAKAVLCYAFGEKVVPVDINVSRVISRLFGFRISEDTARRDRRLSIVVNSMIPSRRERDFNQALLDFAALVCKPKPRCDICPLNNTCEYFNENIWSPV